MQSGLEAAAETLKHEAAVAKNAQVIFNSPRGVTVGNKDGDVTFVEFFNYNCGDRKLKRPTCSRS